MGINAEIQNLAIRHQHYVERYKTYQARQIQGLLSQAERRVKRKIESYGERELVTKAKQQQLLREIDAINRSAGSRITEETTRELRLFAQSQQRNLARQVRESVPVALRDQYSFTEIGPRKLWAAVTDRPISMQDGTFLSVDEFIGTFNVRTTEGVRQAVRQGYLLGETPKEITKRLSDLGIYAGRQARAATMARTVIAHTQAETRTSLYGENSDIVKGYMWVATLDGRTSDTCAELDGKVWFYDSPGESDLPGDIQPPAHYGCRSTTAPITKSWQELGLDAGDYPAGARASADGEVPGKLTYKEWLDKQPAEIQREVLGPTRYDIMVEEAKPVSYFYDDGGMIPLRDLG